MGLMTVKLSQLRPGADGINARQFGRKDGLRELMASIEAVGGLIQPLAVRPLAGSEGVFEVTDGNRRHAALAKLAGKKGDPDVPVIVHDRSDVDAHEMSLAANVVRVNLHPVDEYEAYSAMIRVGRTPEQIAQRFGAKVAWVKQRLQLAALAPELREVWRKGKMDADQAAALSSTPDHVRQVEVWKKATGKAGGDWMKRPDNLRREARAGGLEQDDGEVVFVGLEAYLAAGGRLSDDLFTEARLLLDRGIVERLVEEKLEAACAPPIVIRDGRGRRPRPCVRSNDGNSARSTRRPT
jgi:ParB family transcriptional regulator, chromosome partitioning protein